MLLPRVAPRVRRRPPRRVGHFGGRRTSKAGIEDSANSDIAYERARARPYGTTSRMPSTVVDCVVSDSGIRTSRRHRLAAPGSALCGCTLESRLERYRRSRGLTAAARKSLLPTKPACSSPGRTRPETYRLSGQVCLPRGMAKQGFGSGVAQLVELVRQRNVFASSNGDRSLETNTRRNKGSNSSSGNESYDGSKLSES